MIFGLAGAQRTGKTTLAKEVASTLGLHYHDASITRIAKEFGANAVGDLDLGQRIALQEFILRRYREELYKAPQPLICDRTPLDFIGYMLGEVTMHNTPVEFHERISAYVDECLRFSCSSFQAILVVRPLPVYETDLSKPPPNRAYQSAVQFIIEGAGMNARYLTVATIYLHDRQQRLKLACEFISRHVSDLELSRAAATSH